MVANSFEMERDIRLFTHNAAENANRDNQLALLTYKQERFISQLRERDQVGKPPFGGICRMISPPGGLKGTPLRILCAPLAQEV